MPRLSDGSCVSGFVWYFHKSYVRQVALVDVDMTSWLLQQEDDQESGGGSGDGGKFPIHVSHTGYWSDGVDLVARVGGCRRLGQLLHQLQGIEPSGWEAAEEQEDRQAVRVTAVAQDEDVVR
jgi:hypothetical protein